MILGFPASLKNLTPTIPPPPPSSVGTPMGNGMTPPPPTSTTPTSGGGGAVSQKKTCPFCKQQLSWHALSRHIRDMHRAKTGYVTCRHCLKVFRNKNSLGCHMWRFHKDKGAGGEQGSGEGNAKEDRLPTPDGVAATAGGGMNL